MGLRFAGCGAHHAADRIAMSDRPTKAIVDLDAIRHNIRVAREHVGPGCRIAAVVKADGYGHGALEVAHDASMPAARCGAWPFPRKG